jgi:hypothetical protein
MDGRCVLVASEERSQESGRCHHRRSLPAIYAACASSAMRSRAWSFSRAGAGDGGKTIITDSDAARTLADWSFESREMFVWHAALVATASRCAAKCAWRNQRA